MIKTFQNPEGHQNCISGSKVTAILLKEWIFPIGGASAVEGLRSPGLPRLVLVHVSFQTVKTTTLRMVEDTIKPFLHVNM